MERCYTVSRELALNPGDLKFSSIRSAGPGGQNVNKVSTAVELRFDIEKSSLPPGVKRRLHQLPDSRISSSGVIIIKAQEQRSALRNREIAIRRLAQMVRLAEKPETKRRKTRPTAGSQRRRVEAKRRRSSVKANRSKVDY